MKERTLKLISKILIIKFLIIFSGIYSHNYSQDNKNLMLIPKIRNYATMDLGFKIDSTFYQSFDESPEEYHYYVYISKSDFPENPDSLKSSFLYAGKNKLKADSISKKWQEKDYQTLIYKTAGTSASELNSILLGYNLEDFCFILLHEAIHVHLRNSGTKLPYEFEESLGDFTGNWGTLLSGIGNFSKTRRLILKNEELYRFMNSSYNELMKNAYSQKLGSKYNKTLKKILRGADSFQKDRFNYSPNNAYFLRNKYYGNKYFFWKYLLFERYLKN